MAAHTRLPPVGLPTHTNGLTVVHVHIIVWCLRRVNHFLRPWAAGPAWTEMMLKFSNYIRFPSFSAVCILSGGFSFHPGTLNVTFPWIYFTCPLEKNPVKKKKPKNSCKGRPSRFFFCFYLFILLPVEPVRNSSRSPVGVNGNIDTCHQIVASCNA